MSSSKDGLFNSGVLFPSSCSVYPLLQLTCLISLQVEGAGLKEKLIEQFTPEDSELLRSRLYSESLNARSTHASQDSISFDEVWWH